MHPRKALTEHQLPELDEHWRRRVARMLFRDADALCAVRDLNAIEQYLDGDISFLLYEDEECGRKLECFVGEPWAPYYAQILELDEYLLFKVNKGAFREEQVIRYPSPGKEPGTQLWCPTDHLEFKDVAFVGAYRSLPGWFRPRMNEDLTQEIRVRMRTSEHEAVVYSSIGLNWTADLIEEEDKDWWASITDISVVERRYPEIYDSTITVDDDKRGDGLMGQHIRHVEDTISVPSGSSSSFRLPETLYTVAVGKGATLPWIVSSANVVPSGTSEAALLTWAREKGRYAARQGQAVAGVYLVAPHPGDADANLLMFQPNCVVYGETSYGRTAGYDAALRSAVKRALEPLYVRERMTVTYVDTRAFEALEQYWEGYREEREGIGLNVREV